jgi:hypothetical protein
MQLWRRARAQLQRAGLSLKPSTTPREAAQLSGLPETADLVSAYLSARWGRASLSSATARMLLRDLDRALNGSQVGR